MRQPGYPVTTSYIGSWDDVGAARTATLALIDRGCRFVLQNADAAGPGVFQAAAERGIFAFGSNRAQHEIAPTAVLASAVIDIPGAFVAVAREVKDGTFTARVSNEQSPTARSRSSTIRRSPRRYPTTSAPPSPRPRPRSAGGTLHVPTAEF